MLVCAIVDRAVRRARADQDRRTHSGQLGQRPAVRLLPGPVRGPGDGGHVPLPGVAAQAAADAPAGATARCWPPLVFLVATFGLRIYLTWITSTGYTYGALATPIAFLLFAFFLGFAIMIGAELNAAIQEEWPAPDTHAKRLRVVAGGEGRRSRNGNGDQDAGAARTSRRRAKGDARYFLSARRSACSPGRPANRAWRPWSPETPRRTARRHGCP